jgi:tetrathionate reductase subunit B
MGEISRREALKAAGTLVAGTAVAGLLPAGEAATANRTPRFAMIMDMRKCIGCKGCSVACKAEYGVPLGRWNTVVKQMESGKYPDARRDFLPLMCNHCAGSEEDKVPPCVKDCPEFPKKRRTFETPAGKKVRYRDGATYKRPDGMILFDNSVCIGCGKCIKACPYGVRYFNPFVKLTREDREGDIGIGKCTMCQHRADKGVVPACVNTCQANARIFGDLNDPDSEVSRLAEEFRLLENKDKTTLLPEEGTVPHVFFIDPDGILANYKIDKETKEEQFNDRIE